MSSGFGMLLSGVGVVVNMVQLFLLSRCEFGRRRNRHPNDTRGSRDGKTWELRRGETDRAKRGNSHAGKQPGQSVVTHIRETNRGARCTARWVQGWRRSGGHQITCGETDSRELTREETDRTWEPGQNVGTHTGAKQTGQNVGTHTRGNKQGSTWELARGETARANRGNSPKQGKRWGLKRGETACLSEKQAFLKGLSERPVRKGLLKDLSQRPF